jgi:KaiC/GvpD/RAD55 family RecA-like ATPase
MLKSTINGLDEIPLDDTPNGSVILVTGTEGTLKSGLIFSMMSNYISANDEHSLYVTFRANLASHLRNLRFLGIKAYAVGVDEHRDRSDQDHYGSHRFLQRNV